MPHPIRAEESRRQCGKGVRVACLLAIVLVPMFGILDAIMFPEHAGLFLCIRLVCAVAAAGILWLIDTPFGQRRPEALALLLLVVVAAGIDVMIAETGGAMSRYYDGLNLLLLAVALLVPWRAPWAAAAFGVVMGGYLVACLGARIEDGRVLANNLFFLGTTGTITVVGAVFADRLREREFDQRHALEEALQHKSEFMAKMSHELRTPLHVIIGYADILLDAAPTGDDDQSRPLIDRIRERGVFLHTMISDLLDYAKIEAGKMEVRSEPVRIADVVEQVAGAFRPLIVGKGLRIRVNCDDALPEVLTDRQRVEQILTNLLANAVKFTARGRIDVEARLVPGPAFATAAKGFRVLAGSPAEMLQLSASSTLMVLVQDTGLGIRESDLGRLAEDFQQIDDVAEQYGGTGLGLSISNRLARLLGGQIAVRSRLAEGSTFALMLPIAEAPRTRHAARAHDQPDTEPDCYAAADGVMV